MLKRALPPALLLLSACTSPEAQPPPSAPPAVQVPEPAPPAIDRKSVPPADGAQPEARAPESTPPVIDRKPMPPASVPPVAGPQVAEATRALFVANCAQCHGEKGDGEGVTQLDRKARSFLEGGFSYGNTKDAILRSITHGIPGTPMPAFEKALDEAQRTALASYVIAFGPDQIVVDPSESELVVKDRPLIVRGKLPPIVEGAKEWPRGLAIGTPDGLTFEYRTDDVQLVGVRAGRFVNRSDWGERGGTALEMLGKTVWSSTSVCNPQFLSLAQDHSGLPERMMPRHTRLLATSIRDGRAELEYVVTVGEGARTRSAVIRESCSAYRNRWGSGFLLRSVVRADRAGTYLTIGTWPSTAHSTFGTGISMHADSSGKPWIVVERSRSPSAKPRDHRFLGQSAWFELDHQADTTVEVFVLTDLTAPFDLTDTRIVDQLMKDFAL